MDFKLGRVLAATYVSICILASLMPAEARVNIKEEQDVKFGKTLAVETIKTEYGSKYDWVDIYKQPALDHPLLKGHKIQRQPSFAAQKMPTNISPSSSTGITKFGLEGRCSKGTVPIRRMTEEANLRAKFAFTKHAQVSGSATGFGFAGISTVPNNNKKYRGAGGYVAIYNPRVDKGQFSSSVISVEGGPPEQFSTIRVGWMVNPDLFGDNLTRLYTLWGQGVDGKMNGCYDTRCPGFVLVNANKQLNRVFNDISNPTGTQFYLKLTISQDTNTGDWWLQISDNDGEAEQIGYWPSRLFTNLKDGAEVLRWGGMVYSDKPNSPPMGSGGRDCHFRRLSIADPDSKPSNLPLQTSESRCYRVGDNSYKKDEYWGYSFWFGGPGGDTEHCH